MKPKITLIGSLLYLGLLFAAGLALLLYFCLPIPPFPASYAIIVAGMFLCGGAFLLRTSGKGSVTELSVAVLLLYLVGVLSFAGFDETEIQAHLFLAAVFLIVWFIAALGIVAAKGMACKWPSAKARRTMSHLAFLPALLAAAGFYLYDLSLYANSARQAAGLDAADLKCNADELRTTKVVPDLEAPLAVGTNTIWCAPFQLAWNDLTDLLGGEIRFAADEPACVAGLNRKSVVRQHLDPDTYLAFAGKYTRDLIEQVNSETEREFGRGTFAPESPPDANTPPSLAAFGYLCANLPFEHAFQREEHALDFNGVPVQSFSIPSGKGDEKNAELAKKQVQVIYPPEEEGSFMVELLTREKDHHLILARIAPETTLAATVDKACRYADTLPRESLDINQELQVPVFNFDIAREYAELTGKTLRSGNPEFSGWTIEQAGQNIRFQLDERGAALRSSALLVSISCMPPAHCIFDQPFLLMLRYRDNPKPYFAMWVDNAEILVKPQGSAE